ncbi:zinc finger protein [Trichonephila clavipes]|nr:zinc finger protein [Trichonephila clavipes]
MMQSYHQEVTKAGENVELLLVKLNVPLFRIPASEKELEKIILRVKNRVSDPPAEKNEEQKPAAVSPPPPASPRSKGRKAKRSGEEGMDTVDNDLPQTQEEVPVVTKKPRIPPFFVSPKGDWRQLVALAKLIAPSFQSQMSGRFLKVTVADDVDYRALSKWLESSGVEFKSFMLKQDRPVKVVIRGLPSNTEPEDIKTEIEAEGFNVLKISQMKNYRTKAPMPLFYLQIQNGADAAKISILPNFSARASKSSPSTAAIKSISAGDVRQVASGMEITEFLSQKRVSECGVLWRKSQNWLYCATRRT